MELGADAVLVNTAIAVAGNQTDGWSFQEAVIAGRTYEAQLLKGKSSGGFSPLTAFFIVNFFKLAGRFYKFNKNDT
jgi:thiazole synthase